MIDLTILVCSTINRAENFYPAIMRQLKAQTAGKNNVQVVCISDNNIMNIGSKRNWLMDMALGKYISYVDDDDLLSDNYVDSLLSKVSENSDVIVFDVMYNNGSLKKRVLYDFNFFEDADGGDVFYRIPNHLMCFNASIARIASFKDINWGEDAIWAKEIKKHIKTQSRISEVLYTYKDNSETSESRKRQ
jgi:glycosyltransferase involved in cell wall biosynthesis